MTDLRQLLTELGAQELPGGIELPVHANERAYFGSLHERLQGEVDRVEHETRALLSREWPEFSKQWTTSKRLLQGLHEEEQLLDDLEQRMNGPFLPAFASRLEQHAKLASSHALTAASVELLSCIASLHALVSTLSSLITDGALASAVAHLPNVQQARQAAPGWIRDTPAFEAVANWATDESARLEESLVRAIESCFVWQGAPGQGSLTIHARVTTVDSERAEEMHVRTLLDDLHALWEPSRKGRIDQLLAALFRKLFSHVLLPVVVGQASISYHPAPPTAIVESKSPPDILANVASFLAFVSNQTSLLSSPYARAITAVLTPMLQDAIVASLLSPALPSHCIDLPPFFDLVAAATKFEQHLDDKGWFAHLPPAPTRVDEDVPERRIIRTWSDRLGHHWANSVSTEVLDRLRHAVKQFKWEAKPVEVSVLIPHDPTPPPSPPRPVPEPIVEHQSVQPARVLPPSPPLVQQHDQHYHEQEEEIAKPKRGKQKLGTKVISTATPSAPAPQPTAAAPTNGQRAATSPRTHLSPPPPAPAAPLSSSQQQPARARAPSFTSAGSPTVDVDDAWGFDIGDDLAVEEAGAPVAMSSSSPRLPAPLSSAAHHQQPPPPNGQVVASSSSSTTAALPPLSQANVLHNSHADDTVALPTTEDFDEEGWGFDAEGDNDAEGAEGLEDEESLIGVNAPISPVPSRSPRSTTGRSRAETGSASVHSTDAPSLSLPPPQHHQQAFAAPTSEAHVEPYHVPDHSHESAYSHPTPSMPSDSMEDTYDHHDGDEDDEEAGWGWDDQPLSIGSSPVLERHSPHLGVGHSENGHKEHEHAYDQEPEYEDGTHDPYPRYDVANQEDVIRAPFDSSMALRVPEYRTETMLVSDLSRLVVQYCEQILDEIAQVRAMQLPASFESAVPALRRTFFSILSLYRAIVPVQHHRALSSVPAIAMQFANDSNWIADELVKLLDRRRQSGDHDDDGLDEDEFSKAVQAMRAFGNEWRAKAVASQRDDLMESLAEANHFLDTDDDARYAACERALRQVVHTLTHISQAWKPVMTASLLYSTLGELVNDVLQTILDDIEDQFDISEDESIRLNRLCKMLHELESVFEGTHTSVGREVPVWFKFVFLSELLEASMADIIFLFDHGHLVDFSIQEIAKLVRALFSDSPLRQKNLEHIMRGHPDPATVASYDEV